MPMPDFVVGGVHGLRQPSLAATLTIGNFPACVNWPVLDAWLQQWMDESPRTLGASGHEVAGFAWRVLQGTAALLRAGGVPVAEAGQVIECTPIPEDARYWRCLVRLPTVEGFPPQHLLSACEAVFSSLEALLQGAESALVLSHFYQRTEQEILPALRATGLTSGTTMTLLRSAWAANIPWRCLGQGMVRLGWGSHQRVMSSSHADSDSLLGTQVAQDKLMAAQWLRRAGLPAPEHHVVTRVDHALQAATMLGYPVVVKPVDRDRGEGVTVDVSNERLLRDAYVRAAAYSPRVLVERQAPGDCHRILVVRGEVMYVVKRLPVAVCGDGRHTVGELVAAANAQALNQAPWRCPPPLPLDLAARECLRRAGFKDTSVPSSGVWVRLRRLESTADGGRDEDCMSALHPDNAALAIRAATLFDLDLAGVDLISPDISISWTLNGAVINEINAAPTLGASQQSIDAMPRLMARLLEARGRIPLEVFAGGEAAWAAARERQQQLCNVGLACFVSGGSRTEVPTGQGLPLAATGTFARCEALLSHRRVAALVMVLDDDDWLRLGLPPDRIDRFTWLGPESPVGARWRAHLAPYVTSVTSP